jgi:hypothetical protein
MSKTTELSSKTAGIRSVQEEKISLSVELLSIAIVCIGCPAKLNTAIF